MKTKEELNLIRRIVKKLCVVGANTRINVTKDGVVNIKTDSKIEFNFADTIRYACGDDEMKSELRELGYEYLGDVPTLDFGGLFKWGTIKPLSKEKKDLGVFVYQFGGKDLSGFPTIKAPNAYVEVEYSWVESFNGLPEGIKSIYAYRCRGLKPGHDHDIDEVSLPQSLQEFQLNDCEPSDGYFNGGENEFCIYDKLTYEDWKERNSNLTLICTKSVDYPMDEDVDNPNKKDINGNWVYRDFPEPIVKTPEELAFEARLQREREEYTKNMNDANEIIQKSNIIPLIQEYMKDKFSEISDVELSERKRFDFQMVLQQALVQTLKKDNKENIFTKCLKKTI